MIKRNEDFKYVDDGIRQIISGKKDVLQDKIDKLNNKSKEYLKQNQGKDNNLVDVAEFLRQIMISAQGTGDDNNTFIMARLFHRKRLFSLENMEEDVRKIVEVVCKKQLGVHIFLDSIVVFKEISTGIEPEQPIYFCDNNETLYALDQASGIEMALRTENLFRPVFYLYLLIDHDDKNIILKEKVSLLSEIGKCIGTLVLDIINKSLDDLIDQL